MGFYEKILGIFILPLLLILLLLMSLGVLRRQLYKVISIVMKVKITVNNRNIYLFPLLALINLFMIFTKYMDLVRMVEPDKEHVIARQTYYEQLYRIYRNFLLDSACVVFIA